MEALKEDPDPGTGPQHRRYVPGSVRPQVMQWGHSSRMACHPGGGRTLGLLRRRFWWPTMERDVQRFVAGCAICARGKTLHRPPAGLLRPLSIPTRPWSHIALDLVTGLPESQGYTTILTIVDRFSKAVHFVPLTKLPSAMETAQLLIENVLRLHGIPAEITSDRGPQFISGVWQAFFRAIGAKANLSSGYHPQTNGQTERANQHLESVLRCVTATETSRWSEQLPWVEYAVNSQTCAATGLSPFEASVGYQPPVFPQQEVEVAVPSVHHHYRRCRRIWRAAREALQRTREQNVRYANAHRCPAPEYRVGEKVWLSTKNIRLQGETKKMSPRYVGPFSIAKMVNPVTIRLRLPPTMRIHPVFHVSLVKTYVSSLF